MKTRKKNSRHGGSRKSASVTGQRKRGNVELSRQNADWNTESAPEWSYFTAYEKIYPVLEELMHVGFDKEEAVAAYRDWSSSDEINWSDKNIWRKFAINDIILRKNIKNLEQENRKYKELVNMYNESMNCPITYSLMREPVIAADGHTYEREAIARWITTNNTSPLTGGVLKNKINNLSKFPLTKIKRMGKTPGSHFIGTITEIRDSDITVDLNHPMAGKDLNFEIELVDVGES